MLYSDFHADLKSSIGFINIYYNICLYNKYSGFKFKAGLQSYKFLHNQSFCDHNM
jgi:hypothetical protein